MKKILSITVLLCLLLSMLSLPVSAAQVATLSVKAYQLVADSYQPVTSVMPADRIVVRILANSAVNSVAGLALTLRYDSTVLAYRNRYTLHISDENGSFSVNNVETEGEAGIRLLWDTTTADTQLDGLLFSFEFEVLGAEVDTTALTLEVDAFFEQDRDQSEISANVNNCVLTLGTVDFSPFQALKDHEIRYDDATLQRIAAAEAAFAGFTGAQKTAFIKNHGDLYKAFTNARPEYNRLAQAAKKEELLAEAEKFISDFAELWVLEKNAEDILDYEEQVNLADATYQALSDGSKTRIAAQYPEKIADLLTAIDDRKYDIQQAEAFREDEYSGFYLLWSIDDATVQATYTDLISMVSAADNAYKALSDYAKTLVSREYGKLTHIQALIDQLAESDKNAAALQETVNAFVQKWSKVFLLNVANVSLKDQSAIEMAIQDSENLDAAAQAVLKSRIDNLKKLLTVIEAAQEAPDAPAVTVPGETVYLPGQTVIVPGEAVTVPGETVTVTDVNVVKTSFDKLVLLLSVIILFGLAITAIPVVLLISVNKKIRQRSHV